MDVVHLEEETGQPPITAVEKQPTLQDLECIIERGKVTFLEVANALCEIKSRNLYLETHPTWEAYVKERWGFSRQHAHRLLQAWDEAKTSPTGDEPKTEREARARIKAKRAKMGSPKESPPTGVIKGQTAKDEEEQIAAREAQESKSRAAPEASGSKAGPVVEARPKQTGFPWWVGLETGKLTSEQHQKLVDEIRESFWVWIKTWEQHADTALKLVERITQPPPDPDAPKLPDLEDRTRTMLQKAFAIRNDRIVDIEDAIAAVREAGFDITQRKTKKLADLFSTDSIKGVIDWLSKNSPRKGVW